MVPLKGEIPDLNEDQRLELSAFEHFVGDDDTKEYAIGNYPLEMQEVDGKTVIVIYFLIAKGQFGKELRKHTHPAQNNVRSQNNAKISTNVRPTSPREQGYHMVSTLLLSHMIS